MDPSSSPSFDAWTQNLTIFLADGTTNITIPIAAINEFNDSNMSNAANYGAQLGASIIMLLALLFTTPFAKFRRTLTILHLLGLVISCIRMGLLYANLLSPVDHFYEFWAGDYSRIHKNTLALAVAGTTLSMTQVIVAELALMCQAWTMAAFWPASVKYTVAFLSVLVTLLTIGSRFAITIVLNEYTLRLESTDYFDLGFHFALIMNAVSIFWFCAVFNAKLIFHIISNRGILPTRNSITSMEVLVMANGILMLFPAVFAGIQFAPNVDFEAGSLTITSVVIVLPLGALIAQRISSLSSTASLNDNFHSGAYNPSSNASRPGKLGSYSEKSYASVKKAGRAGSGCNSTLASSAAPDFATHQQAGARDPIDLELSRIDRFDSE